MDHFDFEKLDAFAVATEMVVRVDAIAQVLPAGRGYMRDQLRRAANSVPLNLAEGAGEFAPAEKARFYRIARRSATEVAAQLLVAARLNVVDDTDLRRVHQLLHRLVSMLVRMVASVERRAA